MANTWKSTFLRILIDIFLVALGFSISYFGYYKSDLRAFENQNTLLEKEITLLEKEITVLEEQITADCSWDHYHALQESTYNKWLYLHPEYEKEFKESQQLACDARKALIARNWDEANRLIGEAYDKLATLPGPPSMMVPRSPPSKPEL